MNKLLRFLDKLYQNVTYIFFGFIIIWLLLLAGFSSCYISIGPEHTYFVADSIIGNLVSIAMFVYFLFWGTRLNSYKKIKQRLEDDNQMFIRVKWCLLIATFLIGVFFVLTLRVIPGADQSFVLSVATEIKNGYYAAFAKGGYGQYYQNQIGIIWLLKYYVYIFGEENYVVLQLFNAVGLVVIYKNLSEISSMFGVGRIGQLLVILVGIIFLPFNLYVTFFYGTILGLAFATSAIRHALLYEQRNNWKNITLSVIYISVSCMLKQNYLVVLLAIVIFAIVCFLRSKKWKNLIWAAAIFLSYILLNTAVTSYINNQITEPMVPGVTPWAWVVMGLQESDLANGWHNAYNISTYIANDFDAEAQAKQAKSDLMERLVYFKQHKPEALRFFSEKVASQWNNPTWQGDWIVAIRDSEITTAKWTGLITNTAGQRTLSILFNTMQFIILFGCFCFVMFDHERWNSAALLLSVIFVGGFLFQFIWEAKAQYTVTYFVGIIPLSVKGYTCILSNVKAGRELIAQKSVRKCFLSRNVQKVCLFSAALILITLSDSKFVTNFIKLEDMENSYSKYYFQNTSSGIKSGVYQISSFGVSDAFINLEKESDGNKTIKIGSNNGTDILVDINFGIATINFVKAPESPNLSLAVYGESEDNKQLVQARLTDHSNEQQWRIQKVSDAKNMYVILYGANSALTYDSENNTLCIEEYVQSTNQFWLIEKSN